jgi:hypothetical protein
LPNFQTSFQTLVHLKPKRIALRGLGPHRMQVRLRSLSRLPQQPHGRDPIAAVPTSRYAHRQGLKIKCAQPVKRSNPYLAISIAVFSALRHRFCAAASQSVLAPGFRGDATLTGRFR